MASPDNPLLVLVRAHGFQTVHGFARERNVSPNIRRYFHGGRRPSPSAICQIARGLGETPEYVAKALGYFAPYETTTT